MRNSWVFGLRNHWKSSRWLTAKDASPNLHMLVPCYSPLHAIITSLWSLSLILNPTPSCYTYHPLSLGHLSLPGIILFVYVSLPTRMKASWEQRSCLVFHSRVPCTWNSPGSQEVLGKYLLSEFNVNAKPLCFSTPMFFLFFLMSMDFVYDNHDNINFFLRENIGLPEFQLHFKYVGYLISTGS